MQKIFIEKIFRGPFRPQKKKKKFRAPFLPWKLRVNPLEKHVNSIFNGKSGNFFSGPPYKGQKFLRAPFFASGPPYKCLWTVPNSLDIDNSRSDFEFFRMRGGLKISDPCKGVLEKKLRYCKFPVIIEFTCFYFYGVDPLGLAHNFHGKKGALKFLEVWRGEQIIFTIFVGISPPHVFVNSPSVVVKFCSPTILLSIDHSSRCKLKVYITLRQTDIFTKLVKVYY